MCTHIRALKMFYGSISGGNIHRSFFLASRLSAWLGRAAFGVMRIYDPFQATWISLRMEKPCLKRSLIYFLSRLGCRLSHEWYRSARVQRRDAAYPTAGWRVLRVDLFRVKYGGWVAAALGVGRVYPVRNTRRFPRLPPELVIYLRMECWSPHDPQWKIPHAFHFCVVFKLRCSRICFISGSENHKLWNSYISTEL